MIKFKKAFNAPIMSGPSKAIIMLICVIHSHAYFCIALFLVACSVLDFKFLTKFWVVMSLFSAGLVSSLALFIFEDDVPAFKKLGSRESEAAKVIFQGVILCLVCFFFFLFG